MAFRIRNKKPPKVKDLARAGGDVLVDMVEHVIGDGPKGSQFFRIFIADPDPEFSFDSHERLEDVEGVEAQFVIQGGFRCQIGFVHTQFLMKNGLNLSRNLRLINHRVHNQKFETSNHWQPIGVEMEPQKYDPEAGMLLIY